MKNMFKNMRLSKLIIMNSSIIMLFTIIISCVSLFFLNDAKSGYDNVLTKDVEVNLALNRANGAVNTIASSQRDMLIIGSSVNEASLSRVSMNVDIINASKETVTAITGGTGNMQEWLNLAEQFLVETAEINELLESGRLELAKDALIKSEENTLGPLFTLSQEIIQQCNIEQANGVELQHAKVAETVIIVVELLFVSLAISIPLSYMVMRSISLPIQEVEKALGAFAEGNFESEITFESKNELGIMCDAMRTTQKVLKDVIEDEYHVLNQMAEGNLAVKSRNRAMYIGSLKPVIEAMRAIGDKLSVTIMQISQSSEQVAAGSSQVSNAAQSLAQGSTEQASAIEILQNNIDAIAAGAAQNTENSNRAIENSEVAGRQIKESAQYMEELVVAMDNISQESEKIGKIVATIENIAFQTNILALNAAVEAARAGAAGKGFAVVADEVRRLASSSSEAAKSITELIDGTTKAIQDGSDIVNNISVAMNKTVEVTTRTITDIESISESILSESESIDSMIASIGQVSTVVQANSATSEETAAASEELSSQAAVMKELIEQFKLRDV